MIQLMLNGKEAVFPQKTSFKLLRCNSYFDTQKGDYTFEVQLPLRGSARNLSIFGAVHRTETSLHTLVGRKIPMVLMSPPLYLKGYAQIKTINEDSVKIQLVSGRSAIEKGFPSQNEYIDELDLGTAWSGFETFEAKGDFVGGEIFRPGTTMQEMKRIFHFMPKAEHFPDITKMMAWGKFGQTDCVAFRAETPPINHGDTGGFIGFYDTHVNPWSYDRIMQPASIEYRLRMSVPHDSTGYHWELTQLAPQPYLFDIIPRIIRAIGYEPGRMLVNYFPDWMKQILIVNTNPEMLRAKCLPHWTVGKFFTEVQRFLGAVWVFRDNTIELVPVGQYYSMKNVCQLLHVVDNYSAEFDEDSDYEGTIGANIDYVWPDMDNKLKLPDEVFENAELLKFPDENAMGAYYSDLSAETQKMSHQLYEVNRSYWASLHDVDGAYSLVKVDMAGALINSEKDRDVDLELNIVPCMTSTDGFIKCTRYYRPTLYSVDGAINTAEETTEREEEERDVMELACNDGDKVLTNSEAGVNYMIPTAIGFPWIINENGYAEIPSVIHRGSPYLPEDGRFSFKSFQLGTVGSHLCNNMKTVDARVEKQFDFLDDIPLDSTVPYLINNRVYACHKIEVTMDENGVQPLKRGYFFELT